MKKFFTLFFAIICIFNIAISQEKATNNEFSKVFDLKSNKNGLSLLALDTLPANFPKITIDSINNPAPGYIFMNTINTGDISKIYNVILDNQGKVFYYMKPFTGAVDFKMQPNGRFSYGFPIKLGDKYQAGPILVQNVMVVEIILDSNFKKIDEVQMQNGYLADIHDFQILPNGNYLLIAYEGNPVDMSKLIEGGNPNAIVVGTVIQELDKNKKCVFQWRSMDYIPILETHDNPLNTTFEHVHGNSVFLDNDGNLIVSLPTTLEIVKLNMITGQIMWHLGGIHNDFEILGEHETNKPVYFAMQHDVKRLQNGNMLFYDNSFSNIAERPWYSRGVEYDFDEINKKATMVWEYRHNPDISAYAMGSVQRLKNGNTLIDWGLIYKPFYRTMTEVTPDNKIAFELSIPSDSYSYRAFKVDLPACQSVADVSKNDITSGNTYSFNDLNQSSGVDINFTKYNATGSNSVNVKKYECSPLNPQFTGEAPVVLNCRFMVKGQNVNSYTGEIRFDLTTLPRHYIPDSLKVYYRPTETTSIFAELKTHFDIVKNQIVAGTSDFGEFIIGFVRNADAITPPTLQTPPDKKMMVKNIPAFLMWSPTGRYDYFRLQIAEDEQFTQVVLDSTNLINTMDSVKLYSNQTYYWRVKTYYRNLESNWSETRSYHYSEPFITLTTPIGKEVWVKDSTQNIVRWQTNLTDSVSITLFRNGVKQTTIKSSLFSYTNAYLWNIPSNIPADSTYTVQIRSLKDSTLISASADNFTIKYKDGVDVEQPVTITKGNDLKIIPNPSSEYSKIDFKINKSGSVKLQIIDQFGNNQQTLVDSYMLEGSYSLGLNTGNYLQGVYYCVLKDIEGSVVEKIVIIR